MAAMATVRDRWAKALKNVLPTVELTFDVNPFLSKLENEILNPYEYAEVTKAGNNRIQQVRVVFRAVASKDTDYIKKFVEILDHPGTEQWAKLIREQAEPAPVDHDQPLPEGGCGHGVMYSYVRTIASPNEVGYFFYREHLLHSSKDQP